jgi:hypothetical protein
MEDLRAGPEVDDLTPPPVNLGHVAQISKPAHASELRARKVFRGPPIGKSAIRQVWKSALGQGFQGFNA